MIYPKGEQLKTHSIMQESHQEWLIMTFQRTSLHIHKLIINSCKESYKRKRENIKNSIIEIKIDQSIEILLMREKKKESY